MRSHIDAEKEKKVSERMEKERAERVTWRERK